MTVQEKQQNVISLGKKLTDILDGLLAVGDWDSSLFLKTAASKLKKIREQTEQLCQSNVAKTGGDKTKDFDQGGRILPGYSQLFVLLYQVDGANLQDWLSTIKNLVEYSVTRPAYKDISYVQEFIRTKTSGIDRNGYAIVNVKDEDFQPEEQQVDPLGHPLVALKENAIKLENIVEFVHENKKRYAIRDNKLVFLGEI